MNVAVYSAKNYEVNYFNVANKEHSLHFIPEELSKETVKYSSHCTAICCFVTDCLDQYIINKLSEQGIQLIALRSTGYDHVDLKTAETVGISVVHVPKYSPEAIAEFTVALILMLSRKILQAYLQGLEYNFTLDNLMGFNIHKKTVGIIGTGNIGTAFAKIMNGFGCKLLATDPHPNSICLNLNVTYVPLETLLNESDILSLHCPLNEETSHFMNTKMFAKMKKGSMLINTGRGALCDTTALIEALESGKVGFAGLDVYEKERGLFFINHHESLIKDKQFIKLQSLPNVIITPHQAFLTKEAVENIVNITLQNITAFENGNPINQIFNK